MADQKITQLTPDTAPTTDDVIVTVNDPGGTPANKKVTLGNLLPFYAASGDVVITSQSTSSSSFTDLATTGPSATVVIGPNGKALITLTADFSNGTNAYNAMSFAASGANTISASDDRALAASGTNQHAYSWSYLATGLNPGSTTFTAKYRCTAGTVSFDRRYIIVIPL